MTIDEIIEFLKNNSSEKYKANIKKLGIPSQNAIGVSTPTLRKLAKKIPRNKDFLLEL